MKLGKNGHFLQWGEVISGVPQITTVCSVWHKSKKAKQRQRNAEKSQNTEHAIQGQIDGHTKVHVDNHQELHKKQF